MRNDLTPFRTVRELLANRDEVLMSNAVGVDGQLYEDSVENLTAILAMQDSYNEMLAALTALVWQLDRMDDLPEELESMVIEAKAATAKAKGAAA
jgi:hypothetical protein